MKFDVVAALRAAPITGPLLRWRYRRNFNDLHRGAGCWYGVYPSFAAATASIPAGAPQGYDQAPAADLYEDMVDRIAELDYPAMFWLSRTIEPTSRLFDLGGHTGMKFYAYRPYLGVLPRRWTVCDVPAVVKAGAERAKARGETVLDFTADFADASGADILMTQGTLQYIESPFAAMVNGLAVQPRHILVNRVPTAADREYITLQNIGVTYCPYRIAREGELTESLTASGYELVDSWVNTSETRNELPYSDAPPIRWMGHYLRLK